MACGPSICLCKLGLSGIQIHPFYLPIVCGPFRVMRAGIEQRQEKVAIAHKLKMFAVCPFKEKFADLGSRLKK